MGNSPKGEYMLKRKNIVKMLGTGCICLLLLGCSEDSFLLQEEETSTVILEEEVVLEAAVSEEEQEIENEIAVHICGAVKQPGVYYLKEHQRLYEGIQKAGGFLEEADQDYLNQAMMLEDGMKITVPAREETLEAINETNFVQTEEDSKTKAFEKGTIEKTDSSSVSISESTGGKIDLNTVMKHSYVLCLESEQAGPKVL